VNVKKEAVVLVVTLAVVGYLVNDRLSSSTVRRGGGGGERREFVEHPAPDLGTVTTAERDPLSWDRDPFSEPSDTRPLPPLALEVPPLPPLEGLAPPGVPAPGPEHFGRYLRRPATPTFVAGLFPVESDDELDEEGIDGGRPDDGVLGGLLDGVADDELTHEERAERFASWLRLYDWIELSEVETLFGQIYNEDRFGLRDRPEEEVLFLEIDPETGEERYPGQGPVPFPRERVRDFGFADTVANRIRIRRQEIGDDVSPGELPDVLAFADRCVVDRLEAPNALETAEELYRLLMELFPDDPAPPLGLARCYEAGFRLDDAFTVYVDLLDRFGHHAEVHVRLAELEARLRLWESAHDRLLEAERQERTSWEVQWAFGRFLVERGDAEGALEHLRLAHRFEPAEDRLGRIGIRYDLGRALLLTGDPKEARQLFRQVLNVDAENQRALAGVRSVAALEPEAATGTLDLAVGPDELEFELLVSLACERLARGELDAEAAHESKLMLETAAEVDPLAAWRAWRALSWLAEVSGYPEEAFAYVELAYEGNPTDPWTLYQRGRLLAQRDDPDGAREMFQRALSFELDFVDALVALAELSFEAEEHEAAERYYERAVSIEPERALVHARRGLNLLVLDRVADADASFEAALSTRSDDPVALAGRAWAQYANGDSDRAIQTFAELDDRRRNAGDADPYRLYAKAQMDRIVDHERKVRWTDRFERRFLRNGWFPEEMQSPTLAMDADDVTWRGAFERDGQVRIFRTLSAPRFVSLAADITVGERNNARVGVFVAKERQVRGGGAEAVSEVRVARHRDGPVQTKVMQNATSGDTYVDLTFPEWPLGEPVRLVIERDGEGSATRVRIVVDGFTVVDGAELRSLFATTSDVRFGVFVEGSAGREADVRIHQFEVVHYE